MTTPEQRARQNIDKLLQAVGWVVQDRRDLNLGAGLGVTVREFQLSTGPAALQAALSGRHLQVPVAGELLRTTRFLTPNGSISSNNSETFRLCRGTSCLDM